jgi:hypothetical protein
MSVHQQVNCYTVDATTLPDHLAACQVMNQASHLLYHANNHPSYKHFHDYWANSTPRTGVRTLRVRCIKTGMVTKVLPQVYEMLAPYEGSYKTYYHDRKLCITLYHRSWQPGQPRIIAKCEPEYELTLPTGSRVQIKKTTTFDEATGVWNYVWVTGTIVRRHAYSQRCPYYTIRADEPLYDGGRVPLLEQVHMTNLQQSSVKLL